jgi:hypothetical protein
VKTEREYKVEARLCALEWTVCQLMVALVDTHASDSSDASAFLTRMHENLIEAARQKTFPELADPAKSDLMSAEFEAAFARLAAMQKLLAEELGKFRGGS